MISFLLDSEKEWLLNSSGFLKNLIQQLTKDNDKICSQKFIVPGKNFEDFKKQLEDTFGKPENQTPFFTKKASISTASYSLDSYKNGEIHFFVSDHDEFTSYLPDSEKVIGGLEYCVFIASLENLKVLQSTFKDFDFEFEYKQKNNKSEISIYEYYYNEKENAIDSDKSEINTDTFKEILHELYPFIDIQKLVDSYSTSKESILIILGEPGTGKTTFLKYLMKMICEKDLKWDIAYCKDDKVLSKQHFWITLKSFELAILDDIDYGIQSRKESKKDKDLQAGNFVNKLLSASDGLFEQATPKVIMTSNMTPDSIDEAIVRPGRCFDILHFRQLTNEEASNIWNNVLKAKDFEKFFGDAEKISQALLMSKFADYNRNEVKRDYILEDGVSIKDKY